MSDLSSLGKRSVVRDSLLPDSPREKMAPESRQVNKGVKVCGLWSDAAACSLGTCGFDAAVRGRPKQEAAGFLGLTGRGGRLGGGRDIYANVNNAKC